MRQDRFYIKEPKKAAIEDSSLVHKIKDVLRKKEGDVLFLFDGKGREYSALISRIKPKILELRGLKLIKKVNSSFRISLAFSLLKSYKIDFILQKATELGVDEFFPFICQNTVVKKPNLSKMRHWERIIIEAVSQSKRLFLPKIYNVVSLSDLIRKTENYNLILIAETSATLTLKNLLKDFDPSQKFPDQSLRDECNFSLLGREPRPKGSGGSTNKSIKNILLFVGPEGGFSKPEIEKFKNVKNSYLVKISNFTLRAETASILLVGLVSYFFNKNEN